MGDLATATRIAVRLFLNGVRYRWLRRTGRYGRPQAVSLEVTHRCVCHCLMCNIWKIPESVPDLPLADWTGLLSSDLLADLRELDITGGEPFLRDDLPSLLEATCNLKRTHLRRLRSIAITTNGVLTERVLRATTEMLEPTRRAGLELVIVCALDAVGGVHDRIRRYEGAWTRLDRTVSGLVGLRDDHPGLIVGLKTTVLPENVGALESISEYARDRGLFTIISPAIVTSGRYLNPDKQRDLALSISDRERLARFYDRPDFRWSRHARTVAQYLRTGRIRRPCTCGFNYLFVRSDGRVFLCPLFADPVGTLESGSADDAYTSPQARAVRRRVGRAPECARCTEPGLERYSLPYEGFAYLHDLFRAGPRAFLEQHRHLGLDKYV